MEYLQQLRNTLWTEGVTAWNIVQQTLQTHQVPEVDDQQVRVLLNTLGYILVPTVLLLVCRPLRRLIRDVLDTVLAVILLLFLLAVVLGLPFGALYFGFRGSMFVITSLLRAFPSLQSHLDTIMKFIATVPEKVQQ